MVSFLSTSAAVLIAALLVAPARACVDGGCSLNLVEIDGSEVLTQLNEGCFNLVPSNTGYFFQLGGDITYTSGVEFTHCDEFGGCRCQNFQECSPNPEGECSCFTPYSCEDSDGLNRCFELGPCDAPESTYEAIVNFNKPCVPVASEDEFCDEKFFGLVSESVQNCLHDCQVGGAYVLTASSVAVTLRNQQDEANLQHCINTQFVGAYDCFAVSLGFMTTTSTTTALPSSSAMGAMTNTDMAGYELVFSGSVRPDTYESALISRTANVSSGECEMGCTSDVACAGFYFYINQNGISVCRLLSSVGPEIVAPFDGLTFVKSS